jgi:tetratricopeptide (TPR) repeat protein
LLYQKQGEYEQAEPLYQRTLRLQEQSLGADHPDTASTLHQLAAVYQEQGQYGEAELLYKRALAIDEKVYGSDHARVATDLNNLAGLYYTQGKYSEAGPLFKRSLAICEQQLGEMHSVHSNEPEQSGITLRSSGQIRDGKTVIETGTSHF